MREIRQRCIHFAEKAAQAQQKFRRMRPGLCQQASRHVGEQPHQPLQTVAATNARESVAASQRANPRQTKLRRAFCKMLERAALQIDQVAFACRVHHLEHERGAAGAKPGGRAGRGRHLYRARHGRRGRRTLRCSRGDGALDGRQMKVVVVFAGQNFRSSLKAIQFARKLRRFRFRDGLAHAFFE